MTASRKCELIDSGCTNGGQWPRIWPGDWTGPFNNNSRLFRELGGEIYCVEPAITWPAERHWRAFRENDDVVGGRYPTREQAQAACEQHAITRQWPSVDDLTAIDREARLADILRSRFGHAR